MQPADGRDTDTATPDSAAVAAEYEPAASEQPEPPHIPIIAEAGDRLGVETTPTWRGWIHAATTPIALAGGIVLICLAATPTAKWASAVYALTSLLLFGNSALYHRFTWSPGVKRTLKRIDHSNIFLLIAGTYTPLALGALAGEPGIVLLSVVWAGALLGIGFRVFWIGAPRWLYVPIYLLLGWAAVMDIAQITAFSVAVVVLVLVGGLLYTVGALAYALKRPNPFPGRFGFHELFHSATVLAYMCHWAAMLIVVLQPVR